MAKTIVGLEITEEGVRAAEVTAGRNPVLLASGSVPLPPGAAKDSEVYDVDAVVLALRQLWGRHRFRSRNVVLGLASRRILVREYTTQALRPDLLRQALPYQVQDLLPVPLDQAVLDFYPASQTGDQLTGLLVAAVAETVEDLVRTITKAKLTVDQVDLAPFGLARAVGRVAERGETVAAFHLGDHTSYIVVVEDGVPKFVRIIPVDIVTGAVRARELASLADLDQSAPADAESALRVPEEALETVPPSPEGAMRRRSSIRAARPIGMSDSAIDDLVGRLRSTLAFFADRAGERPVTRVLLAGAGSAAPGVTEALSASLPIPVQYIGAAEVVGGKQLPEGEDGLNLAATVGLAMAEVR